MQRDNFLAFSQHHGLPTSLIDFSYSPLISLFFACYGESNNNGFIYFIDNKRLINVNSLIGNGFSKNLLQNLFEFKDDFEKLKKQIEEKKFLKGAVYYDALCNLVNMISLVYPKGCIVEPLKYALYGYSKELMQYHKSNNPNEPLKIYSESEKELEFSYVATLVLRVITSSFYAGSFVNHLEKHDLEKAQKICDKIPRLESIDDYIWAFMFVFKFVMKVLINNGSMPNFELPFYLAYTPPEMINRIMNQRSIFIYQLSYENYFTNENAEEFSSIIAKIKGKEYDSDVIKCNILCLQKIIPDFTIEISDKAKILKELDCLGINLKSIYGDYDSIAKYIKSKL